MRSFVELEDVDFAYGAVPVLEHINLTVEPGDFLGIIGPNGSGKTTLLRIMSASCRPRAARSACSATRPRRSGSGDASATCRRRPRSTPRCR